MRHLSALILLAAATTFTTSAQTVMKVKMTSGETTEIPVGKIENVTFGETSEPEQPEAGRPVDLGLSVLWADRNVGATSEFDPGIRCGWGDPTGEKTSNDLDDYPSPLPPENISGTEYDIARAKWGAPWRMPTWEEVYELESKVSAASGYAYGTYYLKATSENGNEIYFPCETEYQGKYWSGTLHEKYTTDAYVLYACPNQARFVNSHNSSDDTDHARRLKNFMIRPVMDKITVSTGTAEDITANSAQLVGTVEDTGQGIEVGFLYGTSQNLVDEGTKVEAGPARGEFNIVIGDLAEGTTYYYCAYAEIAGGYVYGEVKTFTPSGTYEIGDLYPAYDPEGVVISTYDNGKHGVIVSLTQLSDVGWCDAIYDIGFGKSDDLTDGSQNEMPTSTITEWCDELGEGWYIPARGDLITLNREVDKVNETLRSYYNTNSDRYNELYWSSSECSYSEAWVVCVAPNGRLGYESGWYGKKKKDEKHKVCAMKKF